VPLSLFAAQYSDFTSL